MLTQILLYIISWAGIASKPQDSKCFSAQNFRLVYEYISKQSSRNSYQYKLYGIELKNENEIIFNKNSHKIAVIDKTKGVFSVLKYNADNKKAVKDTYKIFCELVNIAQQTK